MRFTSGLSAPPTNNSLDQPSKRYEAKGEKRKVRAAAQLAACRTKSATQRPRSDVGPRIRSIKLSTVKFGKLSALSGKPCNFFQNPCCPGLEGNVDGTIRGTGLLIVRSSALAAAVTAAAVVDFVGSRGTGRRCRGHGTNLKSCGTE